mgnify:CR=1 FL=1
MRESERESLLIIEHSHHFWGHRLKIKIRRGSVFEDAYSQLAGLGMIST